MRFLILFMALLACSCQKSELSESYQEDQQMSFSIDDTYLGSDTRGTGVNDANLNSMAVYGYYSAATTLGQIAPSFARLFDKEKLTRNASGKWTYAPPKYWVLEGYHHFFAFAPYEDLPVINHVNGNYPVMNYDVSLRAKDQKDILWSLGQTVNRVYRKDASNEVFFNLKHALTRITLSGATSVGYQGETVKIEKVLFKNLYRSGSNKLTIDQQNITDAAWDIKTPLTTADFFAEITRGSVTGELKDNLWLTQTMQPLLNADESFYLMPQVFQNRPDGSVPGLEIHFRGQKDNVLRIVQTALLAPVNTNGVQAWMPGQAIDYKLLYNGGGDTPFNLLGVVVPWNSQDIDVSVPASYLNVSLTTIATTVGKGCRVYFSTDAKSVQLTSLPTVGASLIFDATTHNGYVQFPANAPAGTYKITIKADKLSRSVTVTVK